MNKKGKYNKMNQELKQNVPILIVCGQSNAHGHGTQLEEYKKIMVPLKNVWGLGCEYNQAYNLSQVKWSGFVSYGMNLGEVQDHTYCLATEFARKWQHSIDSGMKLPDLYIIQISIGGQGIAAQEKNNCNMWYPHRPKVMQKGALGSVDISLYPLAMEIFPLAMQSIRDAGHNPYEIGFHWNQWETEVDTGGDAIKQAKENYTELFNGFRKALGQNFPLYLYRPLSDVYNNPTGVTYITELFSEFIKADENIKLIDLSQSDLFDAQCMDKGIFQKDLVHYTPKVQKWFAEYQWQCLDF